MVKLEQIGFSNGLWRAIAEFSSPQSVQPAFDMVLNGQSVDGLKIEQGPSTSEWMVDFHVPQAAIGDGVYTFSLMLQNHSDPVAQFAIAGGRAIEQEIWAEIAFLRAELDLLKKSFRLHCSQT